MLKMSNTSFVEMGDRLVVIGDAAIETANLLNREVRRPMSGGLMSAGELDAQLILALIIKEVLGTPVLSRDGNPKEKCYFSVPAPAVDVAGSNITYHTAVLKKIVDELGYSGEAANEALAVVFSECAKETFSALAFSYGSGMTNVCLAFNAMSALEFSVGRGGDSIDNGAATAVGSKAPHMCAIKEAGIDITKPKSREEEAISVYISNLIDYTIDQVVANFVRKKGEIHINKSIPIVVSGGTSLAGGFLDRFKERFEAKRSNFPFKISEIRAAKDPMTAVAQGLLMLAQMDSDD